MSSFNTWVSVSHLIEKRELHDLHNEIYGLKQEIDRLSQENADLKLAINRFEIECEGRVGRTTNGG